MASRRIELIDVARGVAALMVTWGHIVRNNPPVMTAAWIDDILQGSGRYGYLGVYIFFMVSGYVIPFALLRVDYDIGMFWRFMAKRLARLQPPYCVSVVLCLAVAFAATAVPSYHGVPFAPDPVGLALHVIYLPTVFGHEWVNPVYWSLLVEVEYYIVIGLVMPLLMKASRTGLAIALAAACAVPFVLSNSFHLPFFLPFFVVGAATCLEASGRLSRLGMFFVVACAVLALLLYREPQFAICAAVTVPFLMSRAGAPRLLVRLGDISYSLYLVHYVVGWRAVRLFLRYAHTDAARVAAYLAALALSIVAAIAFYWLIERASLRWSAKVRLGRKRDTAAEDASAIAAP